ncbi:MAG: mycothiol synthase, partial [Mycobacterium sp.]
RGEVFDLLDAVTAADGIAPVSEQVLLQLRHVGDADADIDIDMTAAHLLARDPAGALVGYACLDARSNARSNATDKIVGGVAELAVHPAHRRRGVGSALVAALLDEVAGPGSAADGRLRLWAHGEQPGAAALAGHFGFHKARVLWRMGRSLRTPLPAVELPEGVRLRPLRVSHDEQAVIEVNNRAFAWHPEQAGWDIAQITLRQAEPWFDPDGVLLAVDDSDRLLGFHWTKVHGREGGHEPIGEVYIVGVDPSAQGRRLGTALTLAGLAYLRDKGLSQVMLYVEADNAPAISVYRRLGFTHWDTDVSYQR